MEIAPFDIKVNGADSRWTTEISRWVEHRVCSVWYRDTTMPQYLCPFLGCDKSFNRPSRLVQHERMHTKEVLIVWNLFCVYFDWIVETVKPLARCCWTGVRLNPGMYIVNKCNWIFTDLIIYRYLELRCHRISVLFVIKAATVAYFEV